MDLFARMVARLRLYVAPPVKPVWHRMELPLRPAYSVQAVGEPHPEYPGEFQWGVSLDRSATLVEAMAAASGWAVRARDLVARCRERPWAVVVLDYDGEVMLTVRLEQPQPAGGAA